MKGVVVENMNQKGTMVEQYIDKWNKKIVSLKYRVSLKLQLSTYNVYIYVHIYRVSANAAGRTKTICCKKVDHFSEILRKYKWKKPKPATKIFLRQKKVSYFFKQV